MQWRVLLGAAREAAREHTLQGVLERFTEVTVEVRVDQRVERWVEVAYPEEDCDNNVGAVTGVPTQRRDHVPENENQHINETPCRKKQSFETEASNRGHISIS